MKDRNGKENNYIVIATIAAIAVTTVLMFFFVQEETVNYLNEYIKQLNIFTYIIGCISFFLTYLAVYTTLQLPSDNFFKIRKVNSSVFLVMVMTSFSIVVTVIIQGEKDSLGYAEQYWHKIPVVFLFLVILLICLGSTFICRRNIKDTQVKRDYVNAWVCGLLFLIVVFSSIVSFSITGASAGTLWHFHAYYNSVYNVLHGIPYTDAVTSIYGHYALIYAIPLKVFTILGGRNILDAFVVIVSLVSGLHFLCNAIVINRLVSNPTLRFMAYIALCFSKISLLDHAYFQNDPHRTFAIGIMTLWMLKDSNNIHKEKKMEMIGFLISVFCVLWSNDTGVIMLVAWILFLGIGNIMKGSWRKALLSLAEGVVAFLAAYTVVGIYNLWMGDSFGTIKDFIIPIGISSYTSGWLQSPLTSKCLLGLIIMLVFLAAFCYALTKMRTDRSNNKNIDFYMGIALVGLGALVYAVNRPACNNFTIVYAPLIIIISVIADKTMIHFENRKRESDCTEKLFRSYIALISVSILLVFDIGCISNYGMIMNQKLKKWCSKEDRELAKQIKSSVDLDTVGIGLGVTELWSLDNSDTKCFIMDTSDISISEKMQEYAGKEIGKLTEVPVIISSAGLARFQAYESTKIVEILENHELETIYSGSNGSEYYYYIPKR